MAAPSPKKTPARKTPAKKSVEAVEERVDRFESLRERARNLPEFEMPAADRPPLVLGEEDGFDPPLEVAWPTDLTTQLLIDEASRINDSLGMLRAIVGRQRFYAITQLFDGEPDALRLLAALAMRITDHFIGNGASKSGGTRAS